MFLILFSSLAFAEPTDFPVDILLVSDRSGSMYHYNQKQFYDDVIAHSYLWGTNFRVGITSCDPVEAESVAWMDQSNFTLGTLHQNVLNLSSPSDHCYQAATSFLSSKNNFHRMGVPLLVVVFTDDGKQVAILSNPKEIRE